MRRCQARNWVNKGERCERAMGEPIPCAKTASIWLNILVSFTLLLLVVLILLSLSLFVVDVVVVVVVVDVVDSVVLAVGCSDGEVSILSGLSEPDVDVI
jgi:hypothetical protein